METNRVGQRVLFAALNALDASQRETMMLTRGHSRRLGGIASALGRIEAKVDDTNARVRSLEEGVAEIEGLLGQTLDE